MQYVNFTLVRVIAGLFPKEFVGDPEVLLHPVGIDFGAFYAELLESFMGVGLIQQHPDDIAVFSHIFHGLGHP